MGARVSLRIGLLVVVLNGLLGNCDRGHSRVREEVGQRHYRVMDGLMAFRAILLAIALAATLARLKPTWSWR